MSRSSGSGLAISVAAKERIGFERGEIEYGDGDVCAGYVVSESSCGIFCFGCVAAGEDHGGSLAGKLEGSLVADTAVAAGDDGTSAILTRHVVHCPGFAHVCPLTNPW